jgi:hypothetical protein
MRINRTYRPRKSVRLFDLVLCIRNDQPCTHAVTLEIVRIPEGHEIDHEARSEKGTDTRQLVGVRVRVIKSRGNSAR